MCGIAGFCQTEHKFDDAILHRMVDLLQHRGPDDSGFYTDTNVGIGMRRLSIIDVSGGRQPVYSHTGRFVCVFNGEIYNYRVLRQELKDCGVVFQSNGDAEVIVNLYEQLGAHAFNRMRGMFGVAIWDRETNALILSRDQIGIKPIFFSEQGGSLLFGSEIKSILQSVPGRFSVDAEAIDAILAYTYIPAPLTIWKDIRKLPAGHYLTWKAGNVRIERYWDLLDSYDQPALKADELREGLAESVRSHLVSDVEVGAFLSGGLDSSAVVARMQSEMKPPARAFSVRFNTGSHLFDETGYARELQERYGFELAVESLEASEYARFDNAIRAFDEPFADDSVMPSDAISEMASREVKVVLSGAGGDEFFGGYNRYQGIALQAILEKFPRRLRWFFLRPFLRGLASLVGSGSRKGDLIRRFADSLHLSVEDAYVQYVTACSSANRERLFTPVLNGLINREKTDSLIRQHLLRGKNLPPVKRVMYADVNTYLPEDVLALSDRVGMQHALEIRTPLADKNLAELTFRLASSDLVTMREKKISLREAVRPWVPDSILNHPKQGFEGPTASWFRTEEGQRTFLNELDGKNMTFSRLFNQDEVKAWLDEHVSGRADNAKTLFTLLAIARWASIYESKIGEVA